MNVALETLRRSNPNAFDQFMDALSQQLGMPVSASSFRCPNCNSKLEIRLAERSNGRKRRTIGRSKVSPSADGLNDLLIQLARVRKTTTGTINAEFTKTVGKKIRKLDKKEQRAHKVQWLKSQLSKGRAA